MANHFKWYDADYLFMFGYPLLVVFAAAVSVERRRVYATGVGAEKRVRRKTLDLSLKKIGSTILVWLCTIVLAGIVFGLLQYVFE
jgi:hypothetical protein